MGRAAYLGAMLVCIGSAAAACGDATEPTTTPATDLNLEEYAALPQQTVDDQVAIMSEVIEVLRNGRQQRGFAFRAVDDRGNEHSFEQTLEFLDAQVDALERRVPEGRELMASMGSWYGGVGTGYLSCYRYYSYGGCWAYTQAADGFPVDFVILALSVTVSGEGFGCETTYNDVTTGNPTATLHSPGLGLPPGCSGGVEETEGHGNHTIVPQFGDPVAGSTDVTA